MFTRSFFPRALILQLIPTLLPTFRPFTTTASAMSTPQTPSTFTVDKTIFTPQLYTHLHDFWLEGLTLTTPPGPEHFKRWFGANASAEEKTSLDTQCYENFGHALQSLGPSQLQLPEPRLNEKGVPDPNTDLEVNIARPLLTELDTAASPEAAQTLLSLVILLDQMPRNIYRTPETLPLVYTHYDRLAHALVLSNKILLTSPHLSAVERQWVSMPLMHSEHLPSHDLLKTLITEDLEAAKAEGSEGLMGYLQKTSGAADSHRDMVERFGRYAYRNEFLGRSSTREEVEYLEDEGAESFGVVRGKGKEAREWKGKGRSEL